jgi:polyhydroxyalkanoate synthesis regulator phasin
MGRKKGKTIVYDFLERIEVHFPYLVKAGKMRAPNRKWFFEDFLGCGQTTYRNWWNNGIKRIYFIVLFLLEEIKEHKSRIEILEKQLNELTKK